MLEGPQALTSSAAGLSSTDQSLFNAGRGLQEGAMKVVGSVRRNSYGRD